MQRALRPAAFVAMLLVAALAHADPALDAAVQHLAASETLNAIVEGGEVRVHRQHQQDLAVLAAAPTASLLPLLRHPSSIVRAAVAATIVKAGPERLDALGPLYRDDAQLRRQTFDVIHHSTVAEATVELVCQRVTEPRYADALLVAARDGAATAAARGKALVCVAPTRAEATLALAKQALSRTGDPLAEGAIRLVLTAWLRKQGLDEYALHNATHDRLKITWRPPAEEVLPIARQGASPEAAVRMIVGEAVGWVAAPELEPTVRALAADRDRGVRMITLRSYMQRDDYDPALLERCLADEDGFIADGCATLLKTAPDPARWRTWAETARGRAPTQARPVYADLIRALKKRAAKK